MQCLHLYVGDITRLSKDNKVHKLAQCVHVVEAEATQPNNTKCVKEEYRQHKWHSCEAPSYTTTITEHHVGANVATIAHFEPNKFYEDAGESKAKEDSEDIVVLSNRTSDPSFTFECIPNAAFAQQ